MKHLLNDLSDEEKNGIREQHSGGKKIVIENFNKLINTKLGDAKPYLNEGEKPRKGDRCDPNTYLLPNGDSLVGESKVLEELLKKGDGAVIPMHMCSKDKILVTCGCRKSGNKLDCFED